MQQSEDWKDCLGCLKCHIVYVCTYVWMSLALALALAPCTSATQTQLASYTRHTYVCVNYQRARPRSSPTSKIAKLDGSPFFVRACLSMYHVCMQLSATCYSHSTWIINFTTTAELAPLPPDLHVGLDVKHGQVPHLSLLLQSKQDYTLWVVALANKVLLELGLLVEATTGNIITLEDEV